MPLPIKNFFIETLEVFLIALFIVLPVRYFLIQPFVVKGQSMEPTFYNSDYLIIDELSYHLRSPKRGEVIVFRAPVAKNTYYIKRIIGLPNETVEIKDGEILVFDPKIKKEVNIKEDYIASSVQTSGNVKITLKPDEYFVLGDNRRLSYDSRNWGPVTRSEVVGRVLLRLYPLNQLQAFAAPEYSM